MSSSLVPQPSRPDPPMAPLSTRMIVWVAAGIGAATLVLVVVLWWAGTSGLTGEKLVTARFEALRTGLSIGLGGGGIFALYLAWRRQHSTEIGLQQKQQDQADVARAYELQREDSVARRITELYTMAAEQLNSDKAPVRLAGLYALERLAHSHADQRQTVANLLCAYLRMPYTAPGKAVDEVEPEQVDAYRERVQEREVRLTAQRLLATHLHPGEDRDNPVPTFWADLDLDLTGAILIAFDLAGCVIRNAVFANTTFTHSAKFTAATFIGDATFEKATFADPRALKAVNFDAATFAGKANFTAATFTGEASFGCVSFTGDATFSSATFPGGANFMGASFTAGAYVQGASFSKTTHFTGVTFGGQTLFAGTGFTGIAAFNSATFVDGVVFRFCKFHGPAYFMKTCFNVSISFDHATFTDVADFENAIFKLGNRPGTSLPWLILDGAHFEQGVPPELARILQDPRCRRPK